MVVDDLPWLDRASALVLASVVRRLSAIRVGFLAAMRTDAESFFDRVGIETHLLDPLDDESADSLLRHRFPALPPRARSRLVEEAKGNPLALLELPAALTDAGSWPRALSAATLPLSKRLQAVFAGRIGDLPADTRRLLLLAVLDGTGDLGILKRALGQAELKGLGPAERAQVVRVDPDGRLSFRHPLTRSAVTDLATIEDRREAHRALAPHASHDRRAWHLAEASVGTRRGGCSSSGVDRARGPRSWRWCCRHRRTGARGRVEPSRGRPGPSHGRGDLFGGQSPWGPGQRTPAAARDAGAGSRTRRLVGRGDGRCLSATQRRRRRRHRPQAARRCRGDLTGPNRCQRPSLDRGDLQPL